MSEHVLTDALILLAGSVLAVSLLQRLRFPPMFAYFAVGVVVGPHGFGWVPHTEQTHALAEIGVVFLMFTVGLEFSLPQLVAMRREVLTLGGAQVVTSILAVGGAAWLIGLPPEAALVIGAAFAMSSTAMVTRYLAQRSELRSDHGLLSVAILLFQDISVPVFLILIPALSKQTQTPLIQALLAAAVKGAGVIGLMLVVGRWVLRPAFRVVAGYRSPELFTLLALLASLAAAWATRYAGLSLALGAFVAGMMLGESEFRHQVESDIRPFRDVLLGLFFVMVGMMLDLHTLVAGFGGIVAIALGVALFKAVSITALAAWAAAPPVTAVRLGLVLPQGGEFGLALLVLALSAGLLQGTVGQTALAALIVSMAVAPIMMRHSERLAGWLVRAGGGTARQRKPETLPEQGGPGRHVIIAGYGRVGQNLTRLMELEAVPYLVVDLDPDRVALARAAGESVRYGDATQHAVLESAGLADASAVVLTFGDAPTARKILSHIRSLRADIPVLVRVRDDSALDSLREAGATGVIPETLEASLTLASHLLVLLGMPAARVAGRLEKVRRERYEILRELFSGQDAPHPDYVDAIHEKLDVVTLVPGAYAVAHRLRDLGLDRLSVTVSTLRRGNARHRRPPPDVILAEGDVLVIYGAPPDLERAEEWLLAGPASGVESDTAQDRE